MASVFSCFSLYHAKQNENHGAGKIVHAWLHTAYILSSRAKPLWSVVALTSLELNKITSRTLMSLLTVDKQQIIHSMST